MSIVHPKKTKQEPAVRRVIRRAYLDRDLSFNEAAALIVAISQVKLDPNDPVCGTEIGKALKRLKQQMKWSPYTIAATESTTRSGGTS